MANDPENRNRSDGVGDNRTENPYGADDNRTESPYGTGGNGTAQSDGAGGIRTEDPYGAEANGAARSDGVGGIRTEDPGFTGQTPPTMSPARYWKKGEEILGRYEVIEILGQGGMGVVYHCKDLIGKIELAVKSLPPELSHNKAEMENICENYSLVSQLDHENIAHYKTLEQDENTGEYYLIMEYVEGMELHRWMKKICKSGKLSCDRILSVLEQIAVALDAAHKQGIVHRDVKPDNIMVRPDEKVKVLDFGLAAQIRTSMGRISNVSFAGAGANLYKSPEQWIASGRQGVAADQYSLAVVAYEMLAGHLPFESDDKDLLQRAVLWGTPEKIEGLSEKANAVLAKGLSKKPEDRYGSCKEFIDELAKAMATAADFSNTASSSDGGRESSDGMKSPDVATKSSDASPEPSVSTQKGIIIMRTLALAVVMSAVALAILYGVSISLWYCRRLLFLVFPNQFLQDYLHCLLFVAMDAAIIRLGLKSKKKLENASLVAAAIVTACSVPFFLWPANRLCYSSDDNLWLVFFAALFIMISFVAGIWAGRQKRSIFGIIFFSIIFVFSSFIVLGNILFAIWGTGGEIIFVVYFLWVYGVSMVIAGMVVSRKNPHVWWWELLKWPFAKSMQHWKIVVAIVVGFFVLVFFVRLATSHGNMPEMVEVKAGSFMMGLPENLKRPWGDDDISQHEVRLTRDFKIGKYEVTQAQYKAVMKENPSCFWWKMRGDYPVENVSWEEAMAYCERLTEKERKAGRLPEGYVYSLPTEAQWEYAARGGKGNVTDQMYSGGKSIGAVAWHSGNSGRTTHPVGLKRANELGLHDMNGNVSEWCRDVYEKRYARDPEFLRGQPSKGALERVYRGGDRFYFDIDCRVAERTYDELTDHSKRRGFRVALVPVE
ncbi:MAG: SUMF1/EgtB/PvdO family nonheme iron enzyme [Victivallales bacterium]|nr:SUMF1/EgtB/PvdO family nonheme iron enzyme [Victivallales bacterium]